MDSKQEKRRVEDLLRNLGESEFRVIDDGAIRDLMAKVRRTAVLGQSKGTGVDKEARLWEVVT